MIDSLNGEVLDVGLDHAVIECAGVGYRFLAAPPTLAGLTRGESRRVLTSMVVKDDGVTLYGFTDTAARELFHTLQAVSGLGPKLALACLSVFEPAELARLIAGGEAKAIQSIPGVGKKMAERMVLELKDKVAGYAPQPDTQVAAPAEAGSSVVVEQVVEALVGLGFTERAARPVVEKHAAEAPETASSSVLRAALSELGKR
ncbi:Holliday junction branch migration protein RuvA [Corynebacterium timonense]|uniref:Holliday junction branch migration complex subunit RuvA n=1 Tax=Corynebacterium timonense TaxID=441500 RepID=A0A1H1NKD5_9CORY|nr:Holliday junction branch migration protein RuvA [Corynebacterium timonense]SDR99428.1 Holliday junction DNA helicase subunit RuvA [Corynebacterium timonense]